jgi:putative endonuclease
MYQVYVIKSEQTSRYYIGSTSNLTERLLNHNRGSNASTKPYRPWTLVYSEQFDSRTEALKREHQIKRFKGGEAFKRLIGAVR